VLNGNATVTPATRERVLRAVESTGYKPNLIARAMKTHRSGAVGIVVSDITNPFYPELIEALTAELHQRGLRLVLWNSGDDGADLAAIDAIHQSLVDGLVFTSATDGLASLDAAAHERAPVVLVNRSPTTVEFDRVLTDNYAGGRLVARYLLAHGRRPAVLAGPERASTARDRLRGFFDECRDLGCASAQIPTIHTEYAYAAGRDALIEILPILRAGGYGLFCMNDVMALGATDADRHHGLSLPDDLWVVGFDDIDAASWTSYSLTTVRQPIRAMARAAIDLLARRQAHPDRAPKQITFAPKLVVRASTADAPLP
jgi:LacI family transcriptional regulator